MNIKETIEELNGIHISDEFDDFPQHCHNTMAKAIEILKAVDSAEMPEKRNIEGEFMPSSDEAYIAEDYGFNQALDLCRPLIAKRDLEIAELKAKVEELTNG